MNKGRRCLKTKNKIKIGVVSIPKLPLKYEQVGWPFFFFSFLQVENTGVHPPILMGWNVLYVMCAFTWVDFFENLNKMGKCVQHLGDV